VKYLDHLFRDSGFVELRHQIDGRWITHWFSEYADLRTKAIQLTDRGNLFTSLHRPAEMPDGPLLNDQISRYTRILFDLDPKRPAGTSATDDELAFAGKTAFELREALQAWGWPEPLQAISGNGAHLQYRVALPNDDTTAQMLRVIYRGMEAEFSDQYAKFDAAVRNPGRICALYGSTKRKGENSLDRPHRVSSVQIPEQWKQVRQRQVEGVANYYARQTKTAEIYRPNFRRKIDGRGDYSTLDVVGWFTSHGLYEHHIADNKHAVVCPWEGEHSSKAYNDTLIFEATGGWPGFYCHHGHCDGRGIKAVMQVLGDADSFCGESWRAKR